MSNTTCTAAPRPAKPITSLCCTSRQARFAQAAGDAESSATCIAGCDRSGAGRGSAGKRERRTPRPFRPAREGGVGIARPGPGRSARSSSNTMRRAASARAVAVRTSMPGRGCGCRRRRGCVPPPPPPGRHGSCRPADSRGPADGTNAESRSLPAVPRPKSSRPGRRPPPPVKGEADHGTLPVGNGAAATPPGSSPPGQGRRSTHPPWRRLVPAAARGPSAAGRSVVRPWLCPLGRGCIGRRIRRGRSAADCARPPPDHPLPPAPPPRRSRRKQPRSSSAPKSSGRSAKRAGRIPPEAPPGRKAARR